MSVKVNYLLTEYMDYDCDPVSNQTTSIALSLIPSFQSVSQSDQFLPTFSCTHFDNFKLNKELH